MIVNAKVSSVQFIYPFLFDRVTFERHKDAISKAQWQSSLYIWRKASFPRDDLLAHVERYLNPPEDIAPTSLIWEMDANTLQSPSGMGGKADWFLMLSRKEIQFELISVQLSLFRIGVGFLVVYAKPKSDEEMGT